MNKTVLEYSKLKKYWGALMVKMGLNNESGIDIFEDLILQHSGPKRFFHNTANLLSMLEEYKVAHGQDMAIEFSIWFLNHSLDMKIAIRMNKTIEAMTKSLVNLGASPAFRKKVNRLILSVANEGGPISIEEKILSDIRLASLGMNLTQFATSRALIRNEYPQMSNYLFAQFQMNYLKRLLSKDKIYYTQYFIEKYEAKARMNLMGLIPS